MTMNDPCAEYFRPPVNAVVSLKYVLERPSAPATHPPLFPRCSSPFLTPLLLRLLIIPPSQPLLDALRPFQEE